MVPGVAEAGHRLQGQLMVVKDQVTGVITSPWPSVAPLRLAVSLVFVASAALGRRVAVEVVASYVTVAGTAVPPPSLSVKAIEAGTTGSLKVAVTGARTETLPALAAGVFAVSVGGWGAMAVTNVGS